MVPSAFSYTFMPIIEEVTTTKENFSHIQIKISDMSRYIRASLKKIKLVSCEIFNAQTSTKITSEGDAIHIKGRGEKKEQQQQKQKKPKNCL